MIWIVSQRISRPVRCTNVRRRRGSLRRSRVSPGARVLKSPARTWKPCWCFAMPASTARSSRTRRRLRPVGVHRAQVQAEDPDRAPRGHDLQERAAAGGGRCHSWWATGTRLMKPTEWRPSDPHAVMPHAAARRATTSGRVASWSRTRSGAQSRMTCGQEALAPGAAVADVVGEQPQRQSLSTLPTSVRYGWPMRYSRKYMIQSRVPWMLTGRPTMAMRRRRSGRSAGAMSGSFSLSGLGVDARDVEAVRTVQVEHGSRPRG